MRSFIERWLYVNRVFLEDAFKRAAILFPGPVRFGFIIFNDGEETTMGEFTGDATGEPLTATVSFTDAEGNQTTPDDVPQWASSDESVATVRPNEDGMGATVDRGGPGASQITVTTTDADGDEHVFAGTVTLNPGDVDVGEITFSEGGEPAPEVEPQ